MSGAVFAVGYALTVAKFYFLLRAVVRLEKENAKLSRIVAAIESKSLDNDTVTAGLCCQVEELEKELTAVGAAVFCTDEDVPAASRPN